MRNRGFPEDRDPAGSDRDREPGEGEAGRGASGEVPEGSSGTSTPAPPGGERDLDLPGRELERVIRRAVELQYQVGEGREDRLSDREVIRIGEEVGVEPRHVRRALAEYRSGSLAGETGREGDRLGSLLGPGFLRTSRAVPGSPERLQRELEEHFRHRESLQSVRRLPGMSLWEPAGGVLSAAQRALDLEGRGYQLAKARAVELGITELDEGRSLVTLTLDTRNVRSDGAWGWVFLSFFLVMVPALVVGFTTELSGGFLAALGVLGAAAVAAVGTRRSVSREIGRMRLVLEGLLDRLESGDALRDPSPSWRDRLMP